MAKEHLQETIIAQGVRVEGDFQSEGEVMIEGEVRGSVMTKATLRIGETARISADISAKNALVAGVVEGQVSVEDRLELGEHSVVKGDIKARVLSVAPGAQINGRVSMGDGVDRAEKESEEE